MLFLPAQPSIVPNFCGFLEGHPKKFVVQASTAAAPFVAGQQYALTPEPQQLPPAH